MGDGSSLQRAERLGWLTESTVQPRKRRVIEGVSAASILDLKAELYRQQEDVRAARDQGFDQPDAIDRRKAGVDVSLFSKKNAGVDERDKRDKLEVKTGADRVAECYAALERKAELYERLAAGNGEDEEELYNVDFLQKGFRRQGTLEDERRRIEAGSVQPDSTADHPAAAPGMHSSDMEREQQRQAWEDREVEVHRAEIQAEEERDAKIQAVKALEKESRIQREKAAAVRESRDEADRKKREALKAAYLKKQLQLLKQSKAPLAAGSVR